MGSLGRKSVLGGLQLQNAILFGIWHSGGMNCVMLSILSSEHPSDTCFAKFDVRKCVFSHMMNPAFC